MVVVVSGVGSFQGEQYGITLGWVVKMGLRTSSAHATKLPETTTQDVFVLSPWENLMCVCAIRTAQNKPQDRQKPSHARVTP